MDHLSVSQINLYLQCGLKYRFQYIDEIPKTFRPSALVFGGALHAALAWIHQERIKNNPISREKMYQMFDADWYGQTTEADIHYKDTEDEMRLINTGKEMLGLYLIEPEKPLKGAEVPFVVPLVHPTTKRELSINLEGYFDLIEADDTIVEFKTSATAISPSDVHAHLQLTAYGYAFQLLTRKPANGFKIVNFVKNKKPRIETTETMRRESDYEGFFFLAEQVLKGIYAGVFPPHQGFWCHECEYASLCPLRKGILERREEVHEMAV